MDDEKIEVVTDSPKEQAGVWANRGLPWAVSEYCGLAGMTEDEKRNLMSTAHENAAARYGIVDKQGSAVEGNPLSVPSTELLSRFAGQLVDGYQKEGMWGETFFRSLKYAGIYLRAAAQETHLNLLAHKEFAQYYKNKS